MLMSLQVWLEPSYATSSGRRYCRSHRYMSEEGVWADNKNKEAEGGALRIA